MTHSVDIKRIISGLPTGRTLLWGVVRFSIVLVVTNAIWRETAIAQIVQDFYTAATEKVINLNARFGGTRLKIVTGLRSEFLYNLFVPLMVFAFFPVRRFGVTVFKIALATGFVAVLDLALAVLRNKIAYAAVVAHDKHYYITQTKPDELIDLMTVTYPLVPIVSAILASIIVEGSIRSRMRIRQAKNAGERPEVSKVGRNDPCPCGSGKKYKRCCGSGIA